MQQLDVSNISQFSKKFPSWGKGQVGQKLCNLFFIICSLMVFWNYVAWWDIKDQINVGQIFQKSSFWWKGQLGLNLGQNYAACHRVHHGINPPQKLYPPPPLTLLFSSNLFSKLRSYQAPLFENLEGGSTPPPPPAERGGGEGCTLCFGKMGNLDPIWDKIMQPCM